MTTEDVFELLNVSVTLDPESEVRDGWEIEYEDRHFYFYHNNGLPGLHYDQFIRTADHDKNTAKIAFMGPLTHLEVDGVPGYGPETDATITINENDPFVDAIQFTFANGLHIFAKMPQPEAKVYTPPSSDLWTIL